MAVPPPMVAASPVVHGRRPTTPTAPSRRSGASPGRARRSSAAICAGSSSRPAHDHLIEPGRRAAGLRLPRLRPAVHRTGRAPGTSGFHVTSSCWRASRSPTPSGRVSACRSASPSSTTARRRRAWSRATPVPPAPPSRCSSSRPGRSFAPGIPCSPRLEPDVEALLVNRTSAPGDHLHRARSTSASSWSASSACTGRGSPGGTQVWKEIAALLRRAPRAGPPDPARRCMPDLDFRVEGAEVVPYATAPLLAFRLAVRQRAARRERPHRRAPLPDPDRGDPPALRSGGGGAAARPVRRARAVGPDAPHDAVDPHHGGGAGRSRARRSPSCRSRAATTSIWRRPSSSTAWPAARCRSRSSSAGACSTRSASGALQVSPISWTKEAQFRLPGRHLAAADGCVLPEPGVPPAAPRRLRSAVPVQGAARHPGWEQAVEGMLRVVEEGAPV